MSWRDKDVCQKKQQHEFGIRYKLEIVLVWPDICKVEINKNLWTLIKIHECMCQKIYRKENIYYLSSSWKEEKQIDNQMSNGYLCCD